MLSMSWLFVTAIQVFTFSAVFNLAGSIQLYSNNSGNGTEEVTFSKAAKIVPGTTDRKSNITNHTSDDFMLPPEKHIFGFPAFCSYESISKCSRIPLKHCSGCHLPSAVIFLTFVITLGVVGVVGNLFIIASQVAKKKSTRSKVDEIKTSLALADFASGAFLFTSVAPNIIWTINHTAVDLDSAQKQSLNTIRSNFSAILFLFFYMSSMFQLILMSSLRLHAVILPLQNKQISKEHVEWFVIMMWICGFIFSTIPLWNNELFTSSYQHIVFMHFLTFTSEETSKFAAILMLSTVFITPYFLMMITTLCTLVIAKIKFRQSRKLSVLKQASLRKERQMTRNITMMTTAFTVTTLPFVIVDLQVNFGFIPKSHAALPTTLTFYIFYLRTITNLMISLVCEQTFRKSLKSKVTSLLHIPTATTSINPAAVRRINNELTNKS